MNNNKDKLNEFELPNSSSQEFDEVIKLVNDTKRIELKADYKQSVVTRFRNNLEQKTETKNYFGVKYALVTVIMIIASYFISTQLFLNDQPNIENTLVDLSSDEVNLIVDDFGLSNAPEENVNDINSITIDSLYSANLSETVNNMVTEELNSLSINDYGLNDVENLLSDNEVDLLYAQLIEKEIL